MDWASHVSAFHSQWITRYVDASESQWKTLLDTLLLRQNGEQKFAEGRAILFSPITHAEKAKLLRTLPKNSTYIRSCLKAHWKLKLTIDKENIDHLPAEPIWHSHRFSLRLSHHERERYIRSGVKQLGDILDPTITTRLVRSRAQWRQHLRDTTRDTTWNGHACALAHQALNTRPDALLIASQAKAIHKAIQTIPIGIRANLEFIAQTTNPHPGETRIFPGRNGTHSYQQFHGTNTQGNHIYERQIKNPVGKLANTGRMLPHTQHGQEVAWWSPKDTDTRALGPNSEIYPNPKGWKIDGTKVRLDRLSIKIRTQLLAHRRMKPPAAEESWDTKMPITHPWKAIWKIKSFYATPRDQFTWLKIMHRNLFLNKHNGEICEADSCNELENIKHLATCKTYNAHFWKPLETLMKKMNFTIPPMGEEKTAFWLLGRLSDAEAVPQEQAGLMFIAWRCLYAEIVTAKIDGHKPNLKHAYHRTIQMTITRLKAHGEKWKHWATQNRHTSKKSIIPEQKRERTVICHTAEGKYTINEELFTEHKRTMSGNRAYKAPAPALPPPTSGLVPPLFLVPRHPSAGHNDTTTHYAKSTPSSILGSKPPATTSPPTQPTAPKPTVWIPTTI